MARPSPFSDALEQLLKARFPVLYVETWEESRVLDEITHVAMDSVRLRTPRPVHIWSATTGLRSSMDSPVRPSETRDIRVALERIVAPDGPAVFVFKDVHAYLGEGNRPADPLVVRRIRDIAQAFRTGSVPASLVLVSPVLRIPADLEKDVTVVDFPLPNVDEIAALLEDMVATNQKSGRITVRLTDQGGERLVKAALGLTLHEAENAFARSSHGRGRRTR